MEESTQKEKEQRTIIIIMGIIIALAVLYANNQSWKQQRHDERVQYYIVP